MGASGRVGSDRTKACWSFMRGWSSEVGSLGDFTGPGDSGSFVRSRWAPVNRNQLDFQGLFFSTGRTA